VYNRIEAFNSVYISEKQTEIYQLTKKILLKEILGDDEVEKAETSNPKIRIKVDPGNNNNSESSEDDPFRSNSNSES